MVYRLINWAGFDRTREKFVNHEPQASDLQILRVFYQHPIGKWFIMPLNHRSCGLLIAFI